MLLNYSDVSENGHFVILKIYLLNDSNSTANSVFVGEISGNANFLGEMSYVVDILPQFQKQGIGFKAFQELYQRLSKNKSIIGIYETWGCNPGMSAREEEMSTNLWIFKKKRNEGLSFEDAAKITPSGKWATALGYLEVEPIQEELELVKLMVKKENSPSYLNAYKNH